MRIEFQWNFEDGIVYHLRDVPGWFIQFCCEQLGLTVDDYKEAVNQIDRACSLFTPLIINTEINENTTFKEIVEYYLEEVGIDKESFLSLPIFPSVIANKACYEIEDLTITVSYVLDNYDCGEVLRICFFLSVLQGEVFHDDGISYYMHSNENTSNNLPHVHVSKSGEFDIVVDFLNLTLIEGNIKQRQLNQILDVIKTKQNTLVDYWNNHTNGIKINVDYTLKYM